MAGKSKRPKLTMEPAELESLQRLRQAPTAPLREVQRAQILTRYHAGETVAQIARSLRMTRKSVAKWINRALAVGPCAALKDAYHRPKEPGITEEARAWVVSLACIKPKDLGYAAEMWTRSALANHVRSHAVEAGHIRRWPKPSRPRCSGSWPSNRFTPKRSSIIWSAGIRTSTRR